MKYISSIIFIITIFFSTSISSAQLVPQNPSTTSQSAQASERILANQKAACLAQGFYWLANNTCSRTSSQTASTLQRFRPGVDIQTTGKNIGGISFSGVGSSVLGCVDVGGRVVSSISSIFGKKTSGSAGGNKLGLPKATNIESVAVKDAVTQKQLEEVKKKETCLDGIANTLAKQALAQVTNKTLAWINTGLDGNPFFVTNTNSFLNSIKTEEVRRYIGVADNINRGDGSAVGADVTNKIIEMITGRSNPISSGPTTPAQQAYENFTNDFTNGGWDAWYRMTQLGENPIAGVLTTSEQLGRNIAQQQQNAREEVNRNGGYRSKTECEKYANVPGPDDDPSLSLNPDGSLRCLEYKVVTPGSAIQAQANTVLTSSTRQLEAADELNEVLGAFFDNMLNKLIQRGLNGLHRETTRTLGGSFSASLLTGGNVGAIDMGYQSAGGGYEAPDFDISRPQQLRAVMQTQYDFLNTAKDSQVALERILPTLGALDYCIPGPNPTWSSGLNENYQNFISSLDTPTKGRSTLNNILSTLPLIGGLFGTEDKDIPYALAGTPVLYDKVTEGSVEMGPWSYLYYTKDYARGVKNTDGDWIRGFINSGFNRITTRYQESFTPTKITELFTAVDPNTAFATGAIRDSLAESSNILGYRAAIAEIDPQYDEIIATKESQLAELEEIRSEVNEIVRVAKARHIVNQANAGTPVNMSCIDRAYIIDDSDIVPLPRLESDANNPMIDKYLESNQYFYNNL